MVDIASRDLYWREQVRQQCTVPVNSSRKFINARLQCYDFRIRFCFCQEPRQKRKRIFRLNTMPYVLSNAWYLGAPLWVRYYIFKRFAMCVHNSASTSSNALTES